MTLLRNLLALCCAVPLCAVIGVYLVLGRAPAVSLVIHGGGYFLPISPTSERLSPSIRRVLAGRAGDPSSGAFAWRETQPGFEVGEMPVTVSGDEVDRLLLARVDPTRFKIIARNDSSSTTTVEAWMRTLAAKLVVNGSYYAPSGLPDTPFVADGRKLGPDPYDAHQGAFVVSAAGVAIRDLSHADWHDVMAKATDALVSYPLLLGEDGKARPVKPSSWLANRTFVGLDDRGWVVFGTTKDAYFSLDRLATFLEHTPLGLRGVLNLDGGPVSCQAVASGSFKRRSCGDYEIQADKTGVRKLSWPYGGGIRVLPVVLAVVEK